MIIPNIWENRKCQPNHQPVVFFNVHSCHRWPRKPMSIAQLCSWASALHLRLWTVGNEAIHLVLGPRKDFELGLWAQEMTLVGGECEWMMWKPHGNYPQFCERLCHGLVQQNALKCRKILENTRFFFGTHHIFGQAHAKDWQHSCFLMEIMVQACFWCSTPGFWWLPGGFR